MTLAIATFTLDDGIATMVFCTTCALRIRVSISAIGSLILIAYSPITNWLLSYREFRRALRFHGVLYGPNRTCGMCHVGDRLSSSDCAAASAQSYVAAPATSGALRSALLPTSIDHQ